MTTLLTKKKQPRLVLSVESRPMVGWFDDGNFVSRDEHPIPCSDGVKLAFANSRFIKGQRYVRDTDAPSFREAVASEKGFLCIMDWTGPLWRDLGSVLRRNMDSYASHRERLVNLGIESGTEPREMEPERFRCSVDEDHWIPDAVPDGIVKRS